MNKKYLNQKDKEKLFNDWIANISTCTAVLLPKINDLELIPIKQSNNAKTSQTEHLATQTDTTGFQNNVETTSYKKLINFNETDPLYQQQENYLATLGEILKNKIPSYVRKIAVSNIETAPEKLVQGVLELLKSLKNTRFEMIYLNTDGSNLSKFKPEDIYKAFHGLNISLDRRAANFFCTTPQLPNSKTKFETYDTDLKAILKPLSSNMVCNLNYTFNDLSEPKKMLDSLINYAKKQGFYTATLRFKPAGTLFLQDLPKEWDKYPTIKYALSTDSRVWLKKKSGFSFVIRSTVLEPKNDNGNLFGYIIQPDLTLTKDWKGKVPFDDKKFYFQT